MQAPEQPAAAAPAPSAEGAWQQQAPSAALAPPSAVERRSSPLALLLGALGLPTSASAVTSQLLVALSGGGSSAGVASAAPDPPLQARPPQPTHARPLPGLHTQQAQQLAVPSPGPPQLLRRGSSSSGGGGAPAPPPLVSPPPRSTVAPGSPPAPAGAAQQPVWTDETPAAAAERHRLLGANAQHIDLQSLAQWVESLLPYLGILLVIFVYNHATGLFLCVWLLCSLLKANKLMRRLVAQKRDYSWTEVVAALLYIGTNVAVVVWLTSSLRLHRSFLLRPPASPISVWQAAFLVVVADSLVRFCGLAPKLLVVAAVAALPGSSGPKRQARLLTLLEHVIAGYRALVPIPVWYTYLLTCTVNSVLSSLLCGFYFTVKAYSLLKQGKLLLSAAQLVLRAGAVYGRYLREGEARDATCICPICQDPAVAPVRLDCSHVYCEDCITEWLERGPTALCPLCRANVKPPGLQSYADGATTLLPQLF